MNLRAGGIALPVASMSLRCIAKERDTILRSFYSSKYSTWLIIRSGLGSRYSYQLISLSAYYSKWRLISIYHLNTFLFCIISCRTTTASFQSSLTVLENPVAKSTDISIVTKSRLTNVSCRVHQDQEARRVQSNHTARFVYPTWRVAYRPSAYPIIFQGRTRDSGCK